MAATVTELKTRRTGTGAGGGPTVRAAVDAFLDSPKVKSNSNTLRAYTGVLDRVAALLAADRALADVADAEIGEVLAELWGGAVDVEPQPGRCPVVADLVLREAALDRAHGA